MRGQAWNPNFSLSLTTLVTINRTKALKLKHTAVAYIKSDSGTYRSGTNLKQ
jgi:hypothetical protein